MRKLRSLLPSIVLGATQVLGVPSAATVRSEGTVLTIFEGDRQCGDNPTDCGFTPFVSAHRFLHVIVHDVPGNAAWAVYLGPTCAEATTLLTGGVAVPSSGFREVAADFTAHPGTTATGCLLFRGGFGRATTYYAAYTDDFSLPDAATVLPNYALLGGRVDLPDLDVTYIHRDPAYPYDGTPSTVRAGETVRYIAHVVNQGGFPVGEFPFDWAFDGKVIARGQSIATLAPFSEATYVLALPWSPGSHRLRFEAHPGEMELSTVNDVRSIDTSAISLGFWVEHSAYRYFRDKQLGFCSWDGCTGADSFEDWLQRQVTAWNSILRGAAYPGVDPGGIQMRVRLDKIVIVPDGALPLHTGRSTDTPDLLDHSVDLQWGLPAAGVASAYPLSARSPFRVDWALLHELGHARSLADLYRFDIPVSGGSSVDVMDAMGKPAYDPAAPSALNSAIRAFPGSDGDTLNYQNEERDLMACVCSAYYGPYDALVLNRLRNSRARCGNFNEPCNLGDWFVDIPPRSQIRLVGAGPDARIRLFFDSSSGYGTHRFAQNDSVSLRHNGDVFRFPADPFRAHGSVDRAGHNLMLLEVQPRSGIDRFCFVEPTVFNLAYWHGYAEALRPATFTLRIGRIFRNDCNLIQPTALVNEPFATSLTRSSVMLGARTHSPSGDYRIVHVQLADEAGTGMSGRQVVVMSAGGKRYATGKTDAQGRYSARMPTSPLSVMVDDVTDNHLILGPVS